VHYSMVALLGDLLGIAPWSKVLYGSDGFTLPELYWWGATHGKEALAAALAGVVAYGSLTQEEALEAAAAILHDNARRLYRLEVKGR
ncbi:amidohydrolase, partial [Nitrospinae bacterium AH_259_B05_G02_I21]|nr:amidohydrolase [Nitrospinae bacterium AH_259_B05_G02_I21]